MNPPSPVMVLDWPGIGTRLISESVLDLAGCTHLAYFAAVVYRCCMDMPLFHRPAQKDDDQDYKDLLADIPQHAKLRAHLEAMWSRFRPLASEHWQSEFPRQTHRRFWEMYLCATLLDSGLLLEPLPDDAPDALARLPDGRPVWFEAIAADAGDPDNPNSVPRPPALSPGIVRVSHWPEEQIILRITNAIASKVRQRATRIKRHIVAADDPYVIAVNAGKIPLAFAGFRDPPIIARAVFPIGHQYFTLNRSSLEVVDSGWAFRPEITKKPKAAAASETPAKASAAPSVVPTTLFADDEHAEISAILYSDENVGRHAAERGRQWGDDFVIIHNPFARSPLPRGFFPRGSEFEAVLVGDAMVLRKVGETGADER